MIARRPPPGCDGPLFQVATPCTSPPPRLPLVLGDAPGLEITERLENVLVVQDADRAREVMRHGRLERSLLVRGDDLASMT